MKKDNDERTDDLCPLAEAALLLSSKWDLIIIHNLFAGALHFSELKDKISNSLPKPVTSSSLTRILRKLEGFGLINRIVKSPVGNPIEILYELTEKGMDLRAVIKELKGWGEKYLLETS